MAQIYMLWKAVPMRYYSLLTILDACHNEALKHASASSPTLICGFCSKEQPSKYTQCMNCKKAFGKLFLFK